MRERLINRCDKIALVMFYILMADVCIFGAGKLVSVGPLTFRMLLLGATGLVSLPVIFNNRSDLFKNKYTWVVGGFLAWLIVGTVLGIKNQNPTSLIVTDLKGFLYFALFPIAICLIRTKQRVEWLSKVVMYSALVMSLMHVFCVVWYLCQANSFLTYAEQAFQKHFFYVSYAVSATNVRVNFLSLPCLLFGCALSVYYQMKERTSLKKYLYALIDGFCLFALWLSYTRSVYLAAGISAVGTVIVCLVCTDWTQKRRVIAHLCASIIFFFVITGAFWAGTGTDYFRYGMERALVGTSLGDLLQSAGSQHAGSSKPAETSVPSESSVSSEMTDPMETTEQTEPIEMDGLISSTITSDDLRSQTVSDLAANIGQSPIWGLGLGATIPSRPSGLNEYFFLDLWSKTGLIGLCLYLAPLMFMAWDLLKHLRAKSDMFHLVGVWAAVVLGFVAYSYFTPCMNSSVGIMCYCCTMAVFRQTTTALSLRIN